MAASEHYNMLYDQLEHIVAMLDSSFKYGRAFPELMEGRSIDPDILIGRVKAMNDIADEMRFLEKFRGSLRLVK